jgi:hypothetical protein
MGFRQLFATSWLGLGFAETPITADKRLRFAPPKFATQTSFIRKTLYEIPNPALEKKDTYMILNSIWIIKGV